MTNRTAPDQIEQLLAEGDHAFAARHWERLRDIADEILRIDDEHTGARGYLLAANQMLADEERAHGNGSTETDQIDRRSATRLEVIEALTRIAASSLSISDAFETMSEQVRREVPFDLLGLGVRRPADWFVEFPGIVAPAGGPLRPGFRLPYYGSSSGTVIRTGRPLINADTARRAVSPMQAFVRDYYSIRSSLLMPLHARGRTYGVLSFSSQEPNRYNEEVVLRAQEIVEHLSVLVDYSLLHEEDAGAWAPPERGLLGQQIDSVMAQSLASVAVQLELAHEELPAEAASARRAIQMARRQARETLREADRSIDELRHAAPTSGSLERTLRSEAERLAPAVRVSVEVTGTDAGQLDTRGGQALLRVAQEALSNVARHSQARVVRIGIRFETAETVVCVADDGVGFEPDSLRGEGSSVAGGFGLTSMHERARLANGRLAIRSTPGVGTEVELAVPVRPRGAAAPAMFEMLGVTTGGDFPGQIRVVIVDDHEVSRRSYADMLARSEGIAIVGEAADRETALRIARELGPHVILLDVQTLGDGVVEMVRELRAARPSAKVILVSVFRDEDRIVEGLRAGASGHLAKDIGRENLVHAIHTVHEGGSLAPPVAASVLIADRPQRLTDREASVLALLESGARNKEIAAELSISVGTVKYHVGNIYQKLGAQNRTEAARIAREHGLVG